MPEPIFMIFKNIHAGAYLQPFFIYTHTTRFAKVAKQSDFLPYLAPFLFYARTSSDSRAQSSHPGFSEHLILRNHSPSSAIFAASDTNTDNEIK